MRFNANIEGELDDDDIEFVVQQVLSLILKFNVKSCLGMEIKMCCN